VSSLNSHSRSGSVDNPNLPQRDGVQSISNPTSVTKSSKSHLPSPKLDDITENSSQPSNVSSSRKSNGIQSCSNVLSNSSDKSEVSLSLLTNTQTGSQEKEVSNGTQKPVNSDCEDGVSDCDVFEDTMETKLDTFFSVMPMR